MAPDYFTTNNPLGILDSPEFRMILFDYPESAFFQRSSNFRNIFYLCISQNSKRMQECLNIIIIIKVFIEVLLVEGKCSIHASTCYVKQTCSA